MGKINTHFVIGGRPLTHARNVFQNVPCLLRLLKPLPWTIVTNYAWAAVVLRRDIDRVKNLQCITFVVSEHNGHSDCNRKNVDCNSTALE